MSVCALAEGAFSRSQVLGGLSPELRKRFARDLLSPESASFSQSMPKPSRLAKSGVSPGGPSRAAVCAACALSRVEEGGAPLLLLLGVFFLSLSDLLGLLRLVERLYRVRRVTGRGATRLSAGGGLGASRERPLLRRLLRLPPTELAAFLEESAERLARLHLVKRVKAEAEETNDASQECETCRDFLGADCHQRGSPPPASTSAESQAAAESPLALRGFFCVPDPPPASPEASSSSRRGKRRGPRTLLSQRLVWGWCLHAFLFFRVNLAEAVDVWGVADLVAAALPASFDRARPS